jgi:hypothetical protein
MMSYSLGLRSNIVAFAYDRFLSDDTYDFMVVFYAYYIFVTVCPSNTSLVLEFDSFKFERMFSLLYWTEL